MRPSARRAKRAFDLAIALPGVALLGVLSPVVALAIWIESRGPVFVRRRHVGVQRRAKESAERGGSRLHDLRGRLFDLRRFRVLGRHVRTRGRRRGEHPRLTRVGRLLRRTGLEGLPQMWNVLRGDMSLVGPRPIPAELAEPLYRAWPSSRTLLRHLRPGVFGPGRLTRADDVTVASCLCERLLSDLAYAAALRAADPRRALRLDAGVLARSAARAFARRRARGNDVIRLDLPRRFHQVDLDPGVLARTAPAGMGAEMTEGAEGLTSWWYPARRPGPTVRPLPASVVEEACDDLRVEEDGTLVLVQELRRHEGPMDRLVVELPASLADVHHVSAYLRPVWESLGRRSASAERAALASAAVLARAAASLRDPRARLLLVVEITGHELRLAARSPAPQDPAPPGPAEEALETRLSERSRSRGLVKPAARS